MAPIRSSSPTASRSRSTTPPSVSPSRSQPSSSTGTTATRWTPTSSRWSSRPRSSSTSSTASGWTSAASGNELPARQAARAARDQSRAAHRRDDGDPHLPHDHHHVLEIHRAADQPADGAGRQAARAAQRYRGAGERPGPVRHQPQPGAVQERGAARRGAAPGRRHAEGSGDRHQRRRRRDPPVGGAGHGGRAPRRPVADHLHDAVEQIVRHWYRRGALAWLLWPVSLVFALLVFVRRLLFRTGILGSVHPGIPVIVVGNLSVGGSGKTPLVLWIAEFLKAHGWSPGIVSRGYGGGGGRPRPGPRPPAARRARPRAAPGEVGGEPVVLARRSGCPVWIGAERVKVVEALRARHPETDVLVL